MRSSALAFLLLLPLCSPFSFVTPRRPPSQLLATPTISGNNVDLTPALTSHATEKVEAATDKFPALDCTVNVHLVVNRNPAVAKSHSAEAVVRVKGGGVIRAKVDTGDMYSSIDEVARRVSGKLSQ
jgi:ribosomal subunit interface protein